MNKKILIGSITAVSILLLMPSIPAIQHKIIEEKTNNHLIEQLNLQEGKETKISLIKHSLYYKHPLLYAMVIFIAGFRCWRCIILGYISFDIISWKPPEYEIYHPILFLRCMWLLNTFSIWCLFWNNVSDKLGWNWDNIASIVIP